MYKFSFCAVITNYHGNQDTNMCIESLFQSAKLSGSKLNVIVVDNSGDFIKPSYDVHVIRTGYNIGLSGAWYLGVFTEKAQSSDYIIFINNDATVEKNFFVKLEDAIRRHGSGCAYGPRILYADDPEKIWSRGGKINRLIASVRHDYEGEKSNSIPVQDIETGHLSGCCLIVKRDHLRKIGPIDTRFFFRGEEWDLNYRLLNSGVRLIIADSVIVYHKINASHDRFSPKMLYFAYRAKVLFAKKIFPCWYFFLWYWIAVVYAALIAPRKFIKMAGEGDVGLLRKSLLRALKDGAKLDHITEDDWNSV